VAHLDCLNNQDGPSQAGARFTRPYLKTHYADPSSRVQYESQYHLFMDDPRLGVVYLEATVPSSPSCALSAQHGCSVRPQFGCCSVLPAWRC